MKPLRSTVKWKVIQFYLIIMGTESKKKKNQHEETVVYLWYFLLVYFCVIVPVRCFLLFLCSVAFNFSFFVNFFSPA